MPLCQVTEHNNNAGCHDLGYNRIYLEIFYKYLQQNIIEQKIEHADHKVPEQLYSAFYHRIIEHYIFGQEEPYRKYYQK